MFPVTSAARVAGSLIVAASITGCATTETSRAIEAPKVEAASTPYRGMKQSVVVGKFENQSPFMRGIFSDGVDRLGQQAKSVLVSHLQQTQRFNVMDRANLEETRQEAQYKSQSQAIRGADYVVTGAVAEFGRKEVGDQQLFGILGRGKSQMAYAKVTLNVVNSTTSEVVFSAQGAGEYALSAREVVGFGSTASYDSTLNGKVLDLAMREAVNKLATGLDAQQWGGR